MVETIIQYLLLVEIIVQLSIKYAKMLFLVVKIYACIHVIVYTKSSADIFCFCFFINPQS